jgi:uncharacterized protein (DUF1697 family)
MTSYVLLLRAVNVVGANKLPMAHLKSMVEDLGFQSVRTYIASGNVVLRSSHSEARIKSILEPALAAYAGKPIGVLVRTAVEIAAVHAANPFPHTPPDRTMAFFLHEPPAAGALAVLKNHTKEQLRLGLREIYVHYPDGQGQSRLILPAAKAATARNMNTIAKLAQMAAEL